MRTSTIVSVLFGAGAIATPVIDRRALKVEDVVVTVTDYVTAGQPAVKVVQATPNPSPKVQVAAYHPHAHHYHQQKQPAPVVAPKPSTSSTPVAAPAPKPTTPKAYVPPPSPTTKAAPPPKTSAAVKQADTSDSGSAPKQAGPDNLDPSSSTYQAFALSQHNVHRQNHSVPALTWNDTLAGYAKTVAETCVYAHNRDPGNGNADYPQGYGQNIAAGINPGQVAKVVSNMWYNGEEPLYPTPYGNDSPDMGGFEGWGHYSQAVWESTESVGCYTSSCAPPGVDPQSCKSDGTPYLANAKCGTGYGNSIGIPAYFTVCNYYPSGNVEGGYHNVKQPGNMPTVMMDNSGAVQGM